MCNSAFVGKTTYRLFLQGDYDRYGAKPMMRVKRIKQFPSIRLSKKPSSWWIYPSLWKVVYPERNEYGFIYKEAVLRELLANGFDIYIEVLSDKCECKKRIKLFNENWENMLQDYPRASHTFLWSAYSKIDGGYVGTVESAYSYYQKGIVKIQKSAKDHNTCSIGYVPSKEAWCGWSHRAMCTFRPGDCVKKGDIAYVPSTHDEMIEEMKDYFSYASFRKVKFKKLDRKSVV